MEYFLFDEYLHLFIFYTLAESWSTLDAGCFRLVSEPQRESGSDQASTAEPNGTGQKWSTEEVLYLFELYKERREDFADPKKKKK